MNGVAILVIGLCIALCVVGILYTMREMIKLEALPTRRQVERTIIPADWDRIMKDTQLERRKGKK